jgi:exopolysaccharide biosynthesis polyprenyl glycosylphosphotransferase
LRFLGADSAIFKDPIDPFEKFLWLLFVIIPFGPITLELQGFYSHPLQKTFAKSLAQLARAIFWLGLLIGACGYFLWLPLPPRAVMPMFVAFASVALLVRERITILRFRKRAHLGAVREPVILAGTQDDTRQFRQSFTPEQELEIEVVEEIDIEHQPVADLTAALHRHSVSRVILAGGHSHLHRLQEAIAACEVEGVEAWIIADFIRTSIARPDFDVFGTRPMLVLRTTPDLSWSLLVKDLLDRLGAFFGLIVTAPLFLIIALGIRLTSPGAIIFRQRRSGKNGRPFTMYKFRSMHTDAAMRQAELTAFNQMSGPVFKLADDPRVFPFGRLLRRTSLDELPQLFNVLKGEMSLVGPRPLPIYEVEKFENTAQRRRLSMKPGLTCLWQVSGRNNVSSFEEWVKLDLQYIDNWSLWLDCTILLRTIPVVLFGAGAR